MKKRWIALLAVICVMLSFCGCSFAEIDVDGRLRAPYATGEQNAIQQALEQHVFSQGEASSISYVLKYPKMGEYRSAFVMKDITGDGQDDALAFYALQPEGAMTHIALLEKKDGVWTCVDDVEGLATEIERIQFGDLDGNGSPEMFAGFSMYNTRDRRLMVYAWSNDCFVERYTDTYTGMIVEKLSDDKRDDLLLFRLRSKDETATVTMLSMSGGVVYEMGSASLDGNILQFGEYTKVEFNDTTRGLFQECTKDNRALITELIVWDGNQLTAPLYDPLENITTVSARESGLPAMDINGDGVTEWPQSSRLPGYELVPTEDVAVWMSLWSTWDAETEQVAPIMHSIVNPYDSYYIEIPEEWVGILSANYNAETRRLTVNAAQGGVVGEELFHIVAYPDGEDNPFKNDNKYLYLDSTAKTRYELAYNRDSDWDLSMEQLSSLFHLYTA